MQEIKLQEKSREKLNRIVAHTSVAKADTMQGQRAPVMMDACVYPPHYSAVG